MLRVCADTALSRSATFWKRLPVSQPSSYCTIATNGFITTIAMTARRAGCNRRSPPFPSSWSRRPHTTDPTRRSFRTSTGKGHRRTDWQMPQPVVVGSSVIVVGAVTGASVLVWNHHSRMDGGDDNLHVSNCEMIVAVGDGDDDNGGAAGGHIGSVRMRDDDDVGDPDNETVWSQVRRVVRMIRRLVKLFVVLSPVVALYPVHWMICHGYLGIGDDNSSVADAQDVVLDSLDVMHGGGPTGWYYRVCLTCVEWSGAACIKIMQWAGSRPDMFGKDFCAVFSQLQDDTTPHAWKHTEQALIESFGPDWKNRVRLDGLLGSGCIAQVYKGAVLDEDGTERPVAVKVMHPNVEDDIDADLDLMRLSVRVLEKMNFGPIKNLKWLNLPGVIEEMATMLKIQLDLRTEGEHLKQFNKNFEGNELVTFPELIDGFSPTKRVLMETYCEGVPVMDFIRNNKADRTLLSKMCEAAIQAVCQMIFIDNFMHGDLHPGNVMVSDDYKFILLDVGIVTKHTESDHKLISDILAAFIRCDGQRAGRLMIDDSNIRLSTVGDHAIDEEQFIHKIEWLTVKASGKDYFMEKLGTYITYICNAAATHHVMLNQAFVSAALAVKVEEGIALALDPSIEIWKIAIPIILEGERRHGRAAERAKEVLGWDRFVDWIQGKKTVEELAIEERKKRALEHGL